MSQLEGNKAEGILSYSAILFYSGIQLTEWGLPIVARAACFTQSTNSNIKLIQKLPHRCTQDND